MVGKHPFIAAILFTVGLLVGSTSALGEETNDYETPPVLSAAGILPAGILQGEHHTVSEEVVNDGFMNHYSIVSEVGEFEAHSDLEVRVRVAEIQAILQLRAISNTEAFADAALEAAKAPVETDLLLPAARAADSTLLLAIPVDYLIWTEALSEHASIASEELRAEADAGSVELWIMGGASPRAAGELEALGFTVRQRSFGELSKRAGQD